MVDQSPAVTKRNEGAEPSLQLIIVIGGPIASGKSTLGVAVAREFERRGLATATIDLDLIYEMLEHTSARKSDAATWSRARRMAGALTGAFLEEGVSVVVAEGDFLDERSRAEFVSMLHPYARVRFVTLTVELPTALLRVEQDLTRGISQDRRFLTGHYEELTETLRVRPEHDLCLDTGDITVQQAAESIARWSVCVATGG
jgi:adenylylsulfate kinase-like enzyme